MGLFFKKEATDVSKKIYVNAALELVAKKS